MKYSEYLESCKKFANETKEWGNIDSYQYYTTIYGGWKESCDNAHGGLDVRWSFKMTDKEILDLAPQKFVDEITDNIISLIDNDIDVDDIRDYIVDITK